MSGSSIDRRTGFLAISAVLLALAGPAVAGVSLDMDRDRVFCSPTAVAGTVTVGSFPITQTVALTTSRPDITQVLPPLMAFPPAGGSVACALMIPAPVAEPVEVTITAVNQTTGMMDQATVMILPNRARFYVDAAAPNGGYGSSWGDAFNDLAEALSAGDECNDLVDEIWVAAGTYKPASESASFALLSDLAIYGGFLGTAHPGGGETALDQRDYAANETILSGNIGDAGDDTDNTYHVVTADGTDETAVLDGFTITGGHADGSGFALYGGGMYYDGGSPTLRHCTFSFNYAAQSGGGMYSTGDPTLIDCRFVGNSSDGQGGGMYSQGEPTLIDCTFDGNSALTWGGGMRSSGAPTLTNCAFDGNTADEGGGAYIYGFDSSQPRPALFNCAFHDNWASTGGGIYSNQGYQVLANCTFWDNVATVRGGGIYGNNDAPTLTNCAFSGNTAQNGEALSSNWGDPLLVNCILWDSGDEVEDVSSTITITYSDVRGGWPGEGNIDSDPWFVDPDHGDLRLSAGSPCIDAANSVPAASFDADGQARAVDDPDTPNTGSGPADFVDMGAYEYRPLAAFADFDGDGDVDLADVADFFLYFTGP